MSDGLGKYICVDCWHKIGRINRVEIITQRLLKSAKVVVKLDRYEG